MKKKIVISLWISLVVLIIAFCYLQILENKKEAEKLARQEQIAAEEEAKALEEQQAEEDEEALEEDEYTFTDFEATYFAIDGATVREEPYETAEIVGTLSVDQRVVITGKCNQSDFYRIKVNGEDAYIAFDDTSEEYIEIPLPAISKSLPTATKDILFIGNSITLYPATKDWWGSGWGCGATAPAYDYVHLTVEAKGYSSYDFMSLRAWEFSNTRNKEVDDLDPYITNYQYNTVVIELGENVKGHETHFEEDLTDMITYIKSYNPNARIVMLDNFWKFSSIISTKKAVASKMGCTYVSLSDIQDVDEYQWHQGDAYTTPDGREYTINSFLAGHPNDAGFAAIAQHLISAL